MLVDYSLVKRDTGGLQLHRLTQAAIRHQHHRASQATGEGDQQLTLPPLLTAVDLLYEALPAEIMGEPRNWPRWRALLPHVLAVAARMTDPRGEPAERTGWLLDRAGAYLRVHGQPATARPLVERALRIDEAVYGPDHPTVATALSNLALVLRDLGDAAGARPLLERALRIDEAVYGPDHPTVATRLSNLATVLQDLGDAAGARALADRAAVISQASAAREASAP